MYALDALGHEETIFTRFKTSDHVHKLPATFIIMLESALPTVSETTKASKKILNKFQRKYCKRCNISCHNKALPLMGQGTPS